ncbi:MAG: hypothetical protein Q8Q09_10510 [Deltaproteobacteria bacterium]|nr:hypothetical protein [Deltaproteobacteria bacterium]
MKRDLAAPSCALLLALGVAACSPRNPVADVVDASDSASDSDAVMVLDVLEDVRDAGDTATSPDGADASGDARVYDPRCVTRRPTVGDGVGSGSDRCEGVTPPQSGMGATWCSLGTDVPGLRAPTGFCVRRYASVGLPRVMALAPNGDLFIASPSGTTAAGDSGGRGAIVVLHDDNRDGVAEQSTFAMGGLETVHGLAFQQGFLYFATQDSVQRTPYVVGQRSEQAGRREFLAGGSMGDPLGAQLQRGGRWTHGLAASVNNRVLVTRGEYSSCSVGPDGRAAPGIGEIYEVAPRALNRVMSGFRNPMYARCHFCKDLCMAAELGEDQTTGAVESLVVIDRERWMGYPCCYQRGVGPQASTGLCECVDEPAAKINLGDTPFGFDWERGAWPAPFANGLFVALHGSFYLANYQGAGVVFLQTHPSTGVPLAGTPTRFLEGTTGQATPSLQRPSDVVFARDGRMFVSDDRGGAVYWVAPTTFRQ